MWCRNIENTFINGRRVECVREVEMRPFAFGQFFWQIIFAVLTNPFWQINFEIWWWGKLRTHLSMADEWMLEENLRWVEPLWGETVALKSYFSSMLILLPKSMGSWATLGKAAKVNFHFPQVESEIRANCPKIYWGRTVLAHPPVSNLFLPTVSNLHFYINFPILPELWDDSVPKMKWAGHQYWVLTQPSIYFPSPVSLSLFFF